MATSAPPVAPQVKNDTEAIVDPTAKSDEEVGSFTEDTRTPVSSDDDGSYEDGSLDDEDEEDDDAYLPDILIQMLRSESGRGIADIMQDIHATLLDIAATMKTKR